MQLTSRQQRLEHISCIHGAVRLTRSHNQMQLVDKQNDASLALAHFLQNCLQTLLKFSPVFGARHQRAHIQRKDLLLLQSFRHIPADDPLGKPFHNCRLTDAGFSDQHRIVLRLAGQDPDHIANLRIPSDDRVQLLFSGALHQIVTVFIQCVIGRFRIVTGHPLIAPDRGQCLKKTVSRNAAFFQQRLHRRAGIVQKGQKQMLHRDIFISHPLCLILRTDQRPVQILADIGLPAGHLHPFVQSLLYSLFKESSIYVHLCDKSGDQALLLHQKAVQQVLLLNLLISVFQSSLFQIIHCLDGFLRKFLKIHMTSCFSSAWPSQSSASGKISVRIRVPGSFPALFRPLLYFACSILNITPVISHVNSRVLIFLNFYRSGILHIILYFPNKL